MGGPVCQRTGYRRRRPACSARCWASTSPSLLHAECCRRRESAFLACLEHVLADNPDVVLLHLGPPGPAGDQRGSPAIARLLAAAPCLVVSGHRHWPEPLASVGQAQVLNVHERAVLLAP